MKRKLVIVSCVALALTAGLFAASKFAIRHERLALFDIARNRSVPVDLYVRRDKEMEAMTGLEMLPVAILNQGHTVRSNEYSFVANVLAARGYLVASIQHDLPTDPPLSMSGSPYVGRLLAYERGAANIDFVISELRKREPIANYDQLTLVGHSNGGDISVFYAADHLNSVVRLITLDNLRVPLDFVRAKILSFRSLGGQFKPDPSVVPNAAEQKKDGIEIIKTGAPHTDLSDRGPEALKERLAGELDQFLNDDRPPPKRPTISMPQYSPGAPY